MSDSAKKRILIIDYKMKLGGIAIAVLNFIENMKMDYDIELLLINKGGELAERLPKDLKVHYLENETLELCENSKSTMFKLPFKKFIKTLYYKLACKLFSNEKIIKNLVKKSKNLGKFDLVINNNMDFYKGGFSGPCHNYTFYNADAEKKYLIVHGDVVQNHYLNPFTRKEFAKYTKIFCVSKALCEQMKNEAPEMEDKIEFLLNFQDVEGIKELSKKEKVKFDKNVLNIISVSRLTHVKGFLRSLNAFKRLKDEGYKFCWHILGLGEQEKEIRTFIKENGLEDFVKLYGAKANPFPYIKNADLMYLGSYHESYGLVLIEAMILGVPALSTEVLPAKELLNDFGLICENSEDGIYGEFKNIFEHNDILPKLKLNLANYTYDNKSIKEKFKRLINE